MLERCLRSMDLYQQLDREQAANRIISEIAGYFFWLLKVEDWSKEEAIGRLHRLVDIFAKTLHRLQ